MADEPGKSGSWWATLPGLMTAAAAVITAVTGLVVVLAQNGIIGSKSTPAAVDKADASRSVAAKAPGASESARPAAQAAASGPSQAAAPTAAAPASSSYRSVRVTRRDGSTIELRDDFAFSSKKKFELKSGQSIDFARIARIDVTDFISAHQPATARVTLVDGRKLDEQFDPYWDMTGRNDLGDFYARWPDVQSVEFVRP